MDKSREKFRVTIRPITINEASSLSESDKKEMGDVMHQVSEMEEIFPFVEIDPVYNDLTIEVEDDTDILHGESYIKPLDQTSIDEASLRVQEAEAEAVLLVDRLVVQYMDDTSWGTKNSPQLSIPERIKLRRCTIENDELRKVLQREIFKLQDPEYLQVLFGRYYKNRRSS